MNNLSSYKHSSVNQISLVSDAKKDITKQANSDEHLVSLWLNRSRNPNTRKAYARAFSDLQEFTDGLPLQHIRLEHLLAYQDHLEEQYANASTRRLKINAIRSLFTFGSKLGYLAFNVGAVVEVPKQSDTLAERILTEYEVQRVLDQPRRMQTKVIVNLLYYSAIRVSELVRLKWKDVQINGSHLQITVTSSKSETRSIPLPNSTSSLLLDFRPEEVASSQYVFRSQKDGSRLSENTVYRIVKNIGRKVGIYGLSPHWFRHSHISHALDRGAPITVVRDIAGHGSISTTNRYAHARPNDSSAFYLPA